MAISTLEIKDITSYDTENLVELLKKSCSISPEICEIFKGIYMINCFTETQTIIKVKP